MDKNNFHDFDTSVFIRWTIRTVVAIYFVSNATTITNAFFDVGQSLANNLVKGKGRDHYEWEQDRASSSWKSKLKMAIDECIKNADSFDNFLDKMRGLNYEVKHGKYIAFRAEGQERFTRAKTPGFYYSEENIRFRIDRRLMYRENAQMPPKDKLRFVQMNEKVQSSEGLRRWAMLQNMQSASESCCCAADSL